VVCAAKTHTQLLCALRFTEQKWFRIRVFGSALALAFRHGCLAFCSQPNGFYIEINMTQAVSILLCALGGEGGGVLADWLVDVARIADYPAQATSIPGVAQRTGATTYYLEIYPVK